MLKAEFAALALLLAAGCASADTEADGPSMHACGVEVAHRTGDKIGQAEPPWRITTRRDGDGFVVNIWTQTPRHAPRPIGAPNYVCVTRPDRTAKDGVRLVEVRPTGLH